MTRGLLTNGNRARNAIRLALWLGLAGIALAGCGGSSGGGSSGGHATGCTPAAGSDGCVAAPSPVTVGTLRGAKVAAHGISYYTFTPASPGVYQIALTGQSSELAGEVTSADFGTNDFECDDFATSHQQVCPFFLAAIPYGLEVLEIDNVANTFSVEVIPLAVGSAASTYPTGGLMHDFGSIAGPIASPVDLAPNGVDYLSFTPNATGPWEVSISGATTKLAIQTYTSTTFATPTNLFQCSGIASIDSTGCTASLTLGNPVYFTVAESQGISNTGFTVNIQQVATGLLNQSGASVTVGGIGTAGTIAPFGTSTYSFVATGTSHTIALTSLPGPMNIEMTSGPAVSCTASSATATTASCIVNGLTATNTYTFAVQERAGVGGNFTVNVN